MMRNVSRLWTGTVIAVVLGMAAAVEGSAQKSLYDRLGGEAAVRSVVDDFVARASIDPAVNFTRQGTERAWTATPENVDALKAHLVQFVSAVAGGPQLYEGHTMREAHAGMHITNPEFDALAADLKASLEALKVPDAERDELLAVVGTTRTDVVEAH